MQRRQTEWLLMRFLLETCLVTTVWLIVLVSTVGAAVIAEYDLAGYAVTNGQSSMPRLTNLAPGVTATALIHGSDLTPVSASDYDGGAFCGGHWAASSSKGAGDYFELSLTPEPGYAFAFDNVTFALAISQTAPETGPQSFGFYFSGDGGLTEVLLQTIDLSAAADLEQQSFLVPLTGIGTISGTVLFRWYGFNQPDSNFGVACLANSTTNPLFTGTGSNILFSGIATDIEPPTLHNLPPDMTVNTDAGQNTAVVNWAVPTATDNVGVASFSSDHASGAVFPLGLTTVTYTATDLAGNSTTASFIITVGDNEAPVISGIPGNMSVNTDAGLDTAVVSWTVPTATDNVGVSSFTSDYASGSTFALGSTTVTYTAADAAGNSSTASFNITVGDNQAPVISGMPANKMVNTDAGQNTAVVTWPTPTASDNVGVSSLTSDYTGGSTFGLGTTTVTYTATDAAGNSSTASFTITVGDGEAPVISGMPANMAVNTDAGQNAAVVNWPAPTASDNVGVSSFTSDYASGSAFALGTTTVTYIATDAAGNSSTASFTIAVGDGEAPMISGMPTNMVVNTDAGQNTAVVNWPAPTASDNVGVSSFSSDYTGGSTFGLGTTTVTYTATDAAGNSSTASFTITVGDGEAPVISGMPANKVVNTDAGQNTAVVTWPAPTASDNVGVSTFTSDHASGSSFVLGFTTVTYTATDAVGNSSTASFTITVGDNEAPVISGMPGDMAVNTDAGQNTAVVIWVAPMGSDNVGVSSFTTDHASGSTFALGITTVTYTATDSAGNSSTASFNITVGDNEAPVISGMPANKVVNTDAGQNTAVVSWPAPTASDNVGVSTFTSDHASGSSFVLGFTTVTYTSTDAAGNSSTASFTITVGDNEAPVISGMPGDMAVNTDAGQNTAVVIWVAPMGSDNVGVSSFTTDHASGSTFALGITTVTYTATDAAGNSSTASFTITVGDNEAPVISGLPANKVVNTDTGQNTAVVTWPAPTASDNVGVSSLTSDYASGSAFALGTTTVTYTVTDAAGNSSTASFTITVGDGEAPVISGMPSDMAVNTDAGQNTAVVNWPAPTASDNVGVSSLTSDYASGSTFTLGITPVTYTATDSAGNSSTASFNITVGDNEAPVISGMPANMAVNTDAGQNTAVVSWSAPTGNDNVGVSSFTSDYASGSAFALGTTTVTYTATDAAGNSSTASFTITVGDNEAPVISGMSSNMSVNTDAGQNTAVVSWSAPTASDNVGVSSFTTDHAIGSTFALGITTVIYTATDAAGNSSTASFTITVGDNEAPVISGLPANKVVNTDTGQNTAVVTWPAPTASDNVGVSSFTSDFASGSTFALGTTTVTYTAIDAAGNSSTASFAITVGDNEAPVISGMPPNLSANTDAGQNTAVVNWTAPTASDNVGVSSFTSDYASGSAFALGTTTVTYTATDAVGNSSTASFTITIGDNEAPVISGMPVNMARNTDAGQNTAVVNWTAPTASDNVGVSSFTSDYSSGSIFALGTTTVTYTATDAAGNSTTASFTITVGDNEAPVISGMPGNMAVNTDPGQNTAVVSWTAPTASDNVGVSSFTSDYTSGSIFGLGTTTVTYTAIDATVNSTTVSFTITVGDNEAPVISGMPGNMAVNTDPGQNTAVVTWLSPPASDNVGISTFTSDHASGSSFVLGVTTVTYTATDAAGNSTTASFTITVGDNEAPVISGMPGNISVNTDSGQNTAIVTWSEPTAADNVSVSSFTSDHASGSIFSLGSTTVIYAATDTAGNASSASFTVNVSDAEAPMIGGMPANMVVNTDGGQRTAIVTWIMPTASDNDGIASLTSNYASGSVFPLGLTTVTYTATDTAGNSSTAGFTITVGDSEAPLIEAMPGSLAVNTDPGQNTAVVTWSEPTATDNVGVTSFTSDHASGSSFSLGMTTVIYTATDAAGNSSIASFAIAVGDNEAPVISGVPANVTVNTDPGQNTAAVSWSPPTASDNVGVSSFGPDRASGSTFPLGITTVIYTATDEAGNSSTASFAITVGDSEAPAISGMPANISVNTDAGLSSAVVTWPAPTASDNVGVSSFTSDVASGATFALGSSTVTYTANDAAGNSSTASFTVTVSDNEAPVISGMPSNVTTNTAAGQNTALVTWGSPSATDNVELLSFSADHVSGEAFPVDTTTVTYTATDAAGNQSSASFYVTVTDGDSPVFSAVPGDRSVPTDSGQSYATVSWQAPMATDAVDGVIVPLQSAGPLSGSPFPLGSTVISYVASDSSGHTATASFSVTVVDQEVPAIAGMPANVAVNTDPGQNTAAVSWSPPTASDNVGVNSFGPDQASGSTFPLGITTVTYTATDEAGNSSTASFAITVGDSEAPAISGMPANISVNTDAGLSSAVVTWPAPTVSDNVGVSSFTSDVASEATFALGSSTVTYTAADAAGNSSTASFTVTVSDNEAPVISGMPEDMSVNTDAGQNGTTVSWIAPTAGDNVGVASFSSDHPSASTFLSGTTTVTYTATDAAGNSTSASFKVTVFDGDAPVFSAVPADRSVPTDSGQGYAIVSWQAPTATDAVDGSILPIQSAGLVSGSQFPVGSTAIAYTATDNAGHSSVAGFTVTVFDDEAPLISGMPGNILVNTDAGKNTAAVTWAAPSASDNVAVVSFTADHASGTAFAPGLTTVTYTATDAAGHSTTGSFTITVADGEAPVFVAVPPDLTVSTDPGKNYATVSWQGPTATDAVDGSILPVGSSSPRADLGSGSPFPLGLTTLSFRASDSSGNVASALFTITVVDTEAPLIAGLPEPLVVDNDPYQNSAVVTWPTPVASDAVDGPLVLVIHSLPTPDLESGVPFPLGVTTVRYTATDTAGNQATASFEVTVVDVNDGPVIQTVGIASATQDLPYSYTFAATDVDAGDTLVYSAPQLPAWLDFAAASGVLSGIPGNAEVGPHPVTLRVSDGRLAVEQSFVVTVANVNDPPTFFGLPRITGTVGVAQVLGLLGTETEDVDGDAVKLRYQWRADEVPIDGAISASYRLTPAEAHKAVSCLVIAEDGQGGSSALATASLVVANSVPSLNGPAFAPAVQGQPYSVQVVAADLDGDRLSFSGAGLPVWALLDPATGVLAGTPGPDHVGWVNGILLSVSDGWSSATLGPFDLEVLLDSDGDGLADRDDADDDNDGVADLADAFPLDPAEWADTDGDGVGDNADAFPADAAASVDGDGDGYPEQWNVGKGAADSSSGLLLAGGDADGDGYSNAVEGHNGTDPRRSNLTLPDSDRDGLPDAYEQSHGLDPHDRNDALADSDGDGFSTIYEYWAGLDPHLSNRDDPDRDGDGVLDRVEYALGLDPADGGAGAADPDGDGFGNAEDLLLATLPLSANGTLPDSDGDGIPDTAEVVAGLDPLVDNSRSDSDGDGLTDLIEYRNATLGRTEAQLADLDGDGLPDPWETAHGLSSSQDNSATDSDNDGLGDVQEYLAGLSPTAPDSDADGVVDGLDPYPADAAPLLPGLGIAPDDHGLPGVSRPDAGPDNVNLDPVSRLPVALVPFTFQALLLDAAWSPANSVLLVLNGVEYPMTLSAGDPGAGALFTRTQRLGPLPEYRFHFEARDGAGNSLSRYPATGTLPGPMVELLNGANLLGLPGLLPAGLDAATAFGTSQAFRWISGGLTGTATQGHYEEVDLGGAVVAGEGYFVNRGTRATLPPLAGVEPLRAADWTLTLQPGWNLLANPFDQALPLAAVLVRRGDAPALSWDAASASRWLSNAIYRFDGSDWGGTYAFEAADGLPPAELIPGCGCWVYLHRDDARYELILPNPASLSWR